jgi:uncharacterized protein
MSKTESINHLNSRYCDPGSFWKKQFPFKVQKISLDTGFTCPNRDGSKGYGGCTYCNNQSFNPEYCGPEKSIAQQLNEGIVFFSRKYRDMKYLAYFQAYTNTYADFELIKKYYSQAVSHPDVVGLVIGTRPDCISGEIIDFLSQLSKQYFVALEFGVESTMDSTLKRINRCHTFQETIDAYHMAENKGLHLGAHLIIGLPGENRDDILNHTEKLSALPIHSLKLHHLQIIKHTVMAAQYNKDPDSFYFCTVDEYVELMVDFLERLRPDIIVERFTSQSPPELLIAPQWNGIRNYAITEKIKKGLLEKNTRQGMLYNV